ncbi:hypothetical protein BG005_004725, partial [Podila minutissima]
MPPSACLDQKSFTDILQLYCLIGESEEETGLTLDPASAKFIFANNNILPEVDRHYVTVFMTANVLGSAEARVMEPL